MWTGQSKWIRKEESKVRRERAMTSKGNRSKNNNNYNYNKKEEKKTPFIIYIKSHGTVIIKLSQKVRAFYTQKTVTKQIYLYATRYDRIEFSQISRSDHCNLLPKKN